MHPQFSQEMSSFSPRISKKVLQEIFQNISLENPSGVTLEVVVETFSRVVVLQNMPVNPG